MVSKNLRAAAAALLLGSAAMAGAALMTATPVFAATVRPQVGKPLLQARALAARGQTSAAMAAINQAEAVPNKTSAESQAISQMRTYVEMKTGGASAYEKMIASGQGSASVARSLVGAHYRAGQWKQVIADVPTLRRFGALDANMEAVIVHAYDELGDHKGAIHFLRGTGSKDITTVKLLYAEAFKIGDKDLIMSTLNQLVLATGSPEYWKGAIDYASHTPGLSNHEQLDLLRLRLATGTMRSSADVGGGDDDYTTLAEIAILLHFPGEATAVIQKGMQANAVTGQNGANLNTMAQKQAGAQAAQLQKMAAAANASPKGDLLVTLGETYTGLGRYQDALDAIQAGIKKGVSDSSDAEMRLGQAYLGLGQRAAAAKAFEAVPSTDARESTIANLWNIYARSGSKAPAAAAPAPKAKTPAKSSGHHRKHH